LKISDMSEGARYIGDFEVLWAFGLVDLEIKFEKIESKSILAPL